MTKLPLFPDGVKTFIRLWPALREIYQGLEHGAQKAVEYFDTEGVDVNAYLAPDLARFNAKRFLEVKAKEVGITLEEVPNIGLRLIYAGHEIWILKNNDGDLPPPKSLAKEVFYEQVLPLMVEDDDTRLVKPNIVVIWGALRSYKAISLRLVCPKSKEIGEANKDFFWQLPLPHPAELIGFKMPADADAATQEELTAIERIIFKKVEGNEQAE